MPGLRTLCQHFDTLFCDVWGVVHDGVRAYPGANEALPAFRAAGGTVILVSNAPVPAEQVEKVLAEKGVRRDAWDAIVSSGDVTRALISETPYHRILRIGPERDHTLYRSLDIVMSDVETAEVAVITGLVDDQRETEADYRSLLQRMLARDLALICANPDRHVHVGANMLPCAGLIAALYEEMGGRVLWAGKPYLPIYERAFALAQSLRGGIDKTRILMIGDAVATDLAGAAAFGIKALFVAGGLHRDDILSNGETDEAKLDALLRARDLPRPLGIVERLVW